MIEEEGMTGAAKGPTGGPQAVQPSAPSVVMMGGRSDVTTVDKTAEGGLPATVINEALREQGLDFENMTQCRVVLGVDGNPSQIETYEEKGKTYARIPVTYDVVVGDKTVKIKSYIYTNFEVPVGGSESELQQFNESIATAQFFAKQQVRSLGLQEEASSPGVFKGKVDTKIAGIALKSPTFMFDIRAASQRAQGAAPERDVVDLTFKEGSSASPQTAKKVRLFVSNGDYFSKMSSFGGQPVEVKTVSCTKLTRYKETKSTVETICGEGPLDQVGRLGRLQAALASGDESVQRALLMDEIRTAEEKIQRIKQLLQQGSADVGTLLEEASKAASTAKDIIAAKGELAEGIGKRLDVVSKELDSLKGQPAAGGEQPAEEAAEQPVEGEGQPAEGEPSAEEEQSAAGEPPAAPSPGEGVD